ncbi:hypothetical protein ACVWWO_006420 [Bradyrhizobium sp. F1.13.1]
MAAQLFASHAAATECYRRAMLADQSVEGWQALDAAGHMAVSQPFSRRAGRKMAGPFCVSTASAHAAIKASS